MNSTKGPSTGFIEIRQEQDKTCLVLAGQWTIENAAPIEKAIRDIKKKTQGQTLEVSGEKLEKLDTSGAILLKKILPEGQTPSHMTKEQRALLEFLPSFTAYKPPARKKKSRLAQFFIPIGKKTSDTLHSLYEIFVFIGQVSVRFFQNFRNPRHFRLPSIVRHIQDTGIQALPIVGLLAVLISMVISYQGAVQLKKFGADIYTIDLTVISLLREMGVLVTAIMVAGRSGSAFAAELGVMKLREEINALETMGMDPVEVLVLPRVIALVIALPLLAFFADLVGLAGGSVMSYSLINVSPHQYFDRVQSVITPTMFFVGLIKAPVFAFLISIVGCYRGLNVSGSAESIGKMTTLAVVQSIFVVIMVDALFSIVFSKMDI